jgi:peroxiredoxin
LRKTHPPALLTALYLTLGTALPARAHEGGSLPFRAAPAVIKASVIIGIVGFSLLIGLYLYRAARYRAHRRTGSEEPLPLRWFSRALFGLFALTAMAGLAFFYAQKTLNAAEQERQELHGNAEDAADALGDLLEQTPENEHLPMLIKFTQEESPGLRLAAVNALGDLRKPETADALEEAFRDSSASVRERALELLPDTDPKRGANIVLAALRDDDTVIRETAVRKVITLLGKKPSPYDKSITPLLLSLLNDSSSHVVDSATIALSRVTGHPWRIKKTMPEKARSQVLEQWRRLGKTLPLPQRTARDTAFPAALHPARRAPAPDFQLTDIAGKPLTLAAQRGRVTLLNFWGTWCPPCQHEVPDLKKVDEAYRERGVDLIGIALEEPKGAEGVRDFCEKQGLRYRQALCTRDVQRDYGEVTEVPVTVLIDKQGALRYRWEGPRDFATFRAVLERLLKEP